MDIHRVDQQAGRLKWARERRGYTSARAFAERHGFNYNTYSQHERGHSGITRAAKDYAKALRVSEAWLLTGEGAPAEDLLADDLGSDRLRSVFQRLKDAPPELQNNVLGYAEYVLADLE